MLLQLRHYGEFIVTFEEISHLFLKSVPLTIAKYSTLFLISFEFSEAVARRCSVKKVLLKISQKSQENTCARVSYLSDGQFAEDLSPTDSSLTDSSPKDSSPNESFPERTFPRRTVPRMTFPRTDISPNGHCPESRISFQE